MGGLVLKLLMTIAGVCLIIVGSAMILFVGACLVTLPFALMDAYLQDLPTLVKALIVPAWWLLLAYLVKICWEEVSYL